MEGLTVLSLFDGISCGRVALERIGVNVKRYYASEIKDIAIKVAKANYFDTIQLGDVKKIDFTKLGGIDLLIGGSPCQDLSIAMRSRKGLEGEKSCLFTEFLRALNEAKPRYFLLENVARMSKSEEEKISNALGVKPIRINSSLVSAQLRDRFYWTNIPNVSIPTDRNIELKDILTSGFVDRKKARAILVSDSRPLTTKARMFRRYKLTGFTTIVYENSVEDKEHIRYFNQTELERLQTLPEGYTKMLNRNDCANVIGDCWTVDVIAHIFKGLKDSSIPPQAKASGILEATL